MLYYLAARYSRREELNGYAALLRAAGHRVYARWLCGGHQKGDRAAYAHEDIVDLDAAGTVVCFTEEPRSGHSRGGRHVEFGLALALRKRIVCIGPRENVFYYLPQVEGYDTWKDFLANEGLL